MLSSSAVKVKKVAEIFLEDKRIAPDYPCTWMGRQKDFCASSVNT